MGCIPNNKRAFTLVEMTVVIAIVAVVLSFAISVGTSQIEALKVTTTKQRLDFIAQRISNYAKLYRHLPCPAQPTLAPDNALAGIGQGTNGSSGCAGTIDGATDFTSGSVPYNTIGITEAASLDGWGNRIMLFVDETLTFTGDTWAAGSVQTGYANNGNPSMYVSGTVPANDQAVLGKISLLNDNGATLSASVAFVVLSHGPNGLGAYSGDGTGPSSETGATTEEQENASNFSDDVYWGAFIPNGFDDLLAYRTKWQIEGF